MRIIFSWVLEGEEEEDGNNDSLQQGSRASKKYKGVWKFVK